MTPFHDPVDDIAATKRFEFRENPTKTRKIRTLEPFSLAVIAAITIAEPSTEFYQSAHSKTDRESLNSFSLAIVDRYPQNQIFFT
jgi:hypothetical protein